MKERFHRFAQWTSDGSGKPWAFIAAMLLIVLWASTGPLFGFSDVWQLVINTTTTVITFLMVFLIQNTQNRDAKAMHLKLDELIRGLHGPRNSLIDLEDATEARLDALRAEFKAMRKKQIDELGDENDGSCPPYGPS